MSYVIWFLAIVYVSGVVVIAAMLGFEEYRLGSWRRTPLDTFVALTIFCGLWPCFMAGGIVQAGRVRRARRGKGNQGWTRRR